MIDLFLVEKLRVPFSLGIPFYWNPASDVPSHQVILFCVFPSPAESHYDFWKLLQSFLNHLAHSPCLFLVTGIPVFFLGMTLASFWKGESHLFHLRYYLSFWERGTLELSVRMTFFCSVVNLVVLAMKTSCHALFWEVLLLFCFSGN